MEKIAYILLLIVVICWFVAMIAGMVAAFPAGIIGLIAIVGFGLLFIKVLKERLKDQKQDRYSKEVEK